MADDKPNGGTYYAWSKFKKDVNEWGQVTAWVNVGDTVSQGDLNVSDDEWQSLIDSGAVRSQEYPSDLPADTPPAEYFKANPDKAPAPSVDESSTVEEFLKADAKGEKLPTGEGGGESAAQPSPQGSGSGTAATTGTSEKK